MSKRIFGEDWECEEDYNHEIFICTHQKIGTFRITEEALDCL